MRLDNLAVLRAGKASLRLMEGWRRGRQQEARAFRLAKARFHLAATAAFAAYLPRLTQERIDEAVRQGRATLAALLAAERERIHALGTSLCEEAGLDRRTLRGRLLLSQFVARTEAEVFGRFNLHGVSPSGPAGARFPLP